MVGYASRSLLAATLVVCALSINQSALAGPDWVEDGDAGNQLNTAQPIIGIGGQVQRIFGRLNGSSGNALGLPDDFDDMYQIVISDPSIFRITTRETSTNFQTSLWLFDEFGRALLGNILAPTPVSGILFGSEIQNFATDETDITINNPGIYYICVSSASRLPVGDGGPMFFFQDQFEVSGPDGEGGGDQNLAGWSGEGTDGDYEMILEGVSDVPAPGALALLGIGMLARTRRRVD